MIDGILLGALFAVLFAGPVWRLILRRDRRDDPYEPEEGSDERDSMAAQLRLHETGQPLHRAQPSQPAISPGSARRKQRR